MKRSLSLSEIENYLNNNVALKAALAIDSSKQLKAVYLGNGEHNENFTFSTSDNKDTYVLRVNVIPQPFHKNQVAYEHHALSCLESSGVTPQALYLDDSLETLSKGAMVISYCPGEQLDYDALGKFDLSCAAALMAKIHSVSIPPDCKLYHPTNPLEDLFNESLKRYQAYKASAYENTFVSYWMERFISLAEEQLDTYISPCEDLRIINTETLASHFLLNPNRNNQSFTRENAYEQPGYFIDWERPIVGDIAQDLAYFIAPSTSYWDSSYLFEEERAQAFLREYWELVDGRVSKINFETRLKAYRVMTTLRNFSWCCKALLKYGDLVVYNASEERYVLREVDEARESFEADKAPFKLCDYLSRDFMEYVLAFAQA